METIYPAAPRQARVIAPCNGSTCLALHCRAGQPARLEVTTGRAWVTCEGRQNDWFVDAGQTLAFDGPATLYVSAEGSAPLRLRWVDAATPDVMPAQPVWCGR